MRRKDRAVEDETWIIRFLSFSPIGTLATVVDGQPYINSNIFVYDKAAHVIYMHTARTGRTRANIETSERVCFSVSEMGRLLPANEALEFSVEYMGVSIFGAARVVADDEEAEHALQLLLDKYFPQFKPGVDYRPITADEIKRTSVYRIDIEQWIGKQKQVAQDFPGAFLYDQIVQR